ncbi:MAG TPA: LysR substrate-binding domain-containing protein, partial [Acidimicrobiia bacterium]|nr:LysR substrate-binding domain-containing protein [Acidimicrobiia bacterium]
GTRDALAGAFAAAGVGPAVIRRLAVARAVATGHLVVIPVAGLNLRRRLRAVWRSKEPLAPLAAALLRRAERSRIPVSGTPVSPP